MDTLNGREVKEKGKIVFIRGKIIFTTISRICSSSFLEIFNVIDVIDYIN